MQDIQANLAQEGLDVNNVLQWDGRPVRRRQTAPKTYWQEYVETDRWYQQELVKDIPPDEMYAACEDSDWEDDNGEEDDDESDDCVDEDTEFLDDTVVEHEEDSATDDDNLSDDTSYRSDDSAYRTPTRNTKAGVQWTPEG
jgi:hypothetical protein